MAQSTTGAGRPASKPQTPTFDEQPFAVKLLLLVVILGLIGVAYYFALHMSLAEEISEYLRLSQELADREPIDRVNKRILPENAEIPAFLEDVNRVAELAGLQIRRVEPGNERTESKYVRVPIAMVMEGRFHQFAKFFYNIGQLERAASVHVEHIRYSNPSASQRPTSTGALPEVRLLVDLEATAFRRKPPGARRARRRGATP
jgi:type IV pilus assembly protein PilO